jgi:hypothetical protein
MFRRPERSKYEVVAPTEGEEVLRKTTKET